jgi:hypothetical protein
MRSAADPRQPLPRSPSTALQPPPLLGRGWNVAVFVLLVAALACGAALVGGCSADLAGAKLGSTVCNAVEKGAAVALYSWEAEQEKPIVTEAVATGDADAGHAKLAAQRAQLAKGQTGIDAMDLVCSSLQTAIAAAEKNGGGVAAIVVETVFAEATKLVRLLLDLGVKLPPSLLQSVAPPAAAA